MIVLVQKNLESDQEQTSNETPSEKVTEHSIMNGLNMFTQTNV